ncbi:MAG: GDP-mannose 4,6-dehydratase [Candidatus Nanopelagicaceae bacterium]|nr:GDP-mannose 4,6-dehydratase [Candidatus Nanopelagicaceae bacterium]
MKSVITGISGQDGSYLAELLLNKGYEVHGLIRRSSNYNTQRIDHLYKDPHDDGRLHLHYGDLTDGNSLSRLLQEIKPNEIYNLGCMSHVAVSFKNPVYTVDAGALGTLRLLEAIKTCCDGARLYQASSSEMFGSSPPPQNETTSFHPRSPYACAKVFSFHQCVNYREAYGMFISNGILFNHESERRGENFVTRKITRAAARIKMGLQQKLFLGNLDAKRDWGYAPDFVEAMWLMLQQDEPNDFVVATGEMHTVREFVELAFKMLELDWTKYVEVDPRYLRPTEVDALQGDASKARKMLGWHPKTTFKTMVKKMIDHDLKLAENELKISQ